MGSRSCSKLHPIALPKCHARTVFSLATSLARRERAQRQTDASEALATLAAVPPVRRRADACLPTRRYAAAASLPPPSLASRPHPAGLRSSPPAVAASSQTPHLRPNSWPNRPSPFSWAVRQELLRPAERKAAPARSWKRARIQEAS